MVKELYVSSSAIKVDILIDEKNFVKMRFYLRNPAILDEAMEYCNKPLEQETELDLKQYIPDFISYIERISTDVDSAKNTSTGADLEKDTLTDIDFSKGTTNAFAVYEQIADKCPDLGFLGYPMGRIKELGYVEEQFVLLDYEYGPRRISPLTILYSMGIALVRKALAWEDVTWGLKYI